MANILRALMQDLAEIDTKIAQAFADWLALPEREREPGGGASLVSLNQQRADLLKQIEEAKKPRPITAAELPVQDAPSQIIAAVHKKSFEAIEYELNKLAEAGVPVQAEVYDAVKRLLMSPVELG